MTSPRKPAFMAMMPWIVSPLSYLLSDHLGSTSITTNSSGALVSELRYKPWGETRYSSGTSPTKYQYTGQYSYQSDFGLLFYNARWVDPVLGRFVQADTIIPQNQGVQAWDRYAYTNNNPVRYTDPTGHFPIIPIIALAGIFFILNGTSDSVQTNISPAELESRKDSVELGTALVVTALAIASPIVEAISNTYDCATGYCDPSLMIPGSSSSYANAADDLTDTATDVTPTDLYAFGNTTRPRPPRPGKDVFPDDFGNIGPEYPPFPQGASTFADPSKAPLTGPYYGLPAGTMLPDGMSVIPDGVDINPLSPNLETHHTLYPSTEMPYNEFVRLFQNLPWNYVGKK
jgi:RHS repeat-associated protein